MKFIPLASSSAGNAYLVDDGKTVLLLECGTKSYKRLQQLVHGAGYKMADITACLVTHEHKDHARCVGQVIKAGIPVYASEGTIEATGETRIRPFAPPPGQNVSRLTEIGSYYVVAFRTFHDAKEPIGFFLRSRADLETLAFATDTVNIRYAFPHLTILAVEANYAEEYLALSTKLPEATIQRIRNTHMEIGTLCGWLGTLDLAHCREIYLLHLSDHHSNEGRFLADVWSVTPEGVKITICPKGG